MSYKNISKMRFFKYLIFIILVSAVVTANLDVGQDNKIRVILKSPEAEANYSTAYVNSSDFWDSLDDPSDINTGDLTDDNTYVEVAGDTMTGDLNMSGNDIENVGTGFFDNINMTDNGYFNGDIFFWGDLYFDNFFSGPCGAGSAIQDIDEWGSFSCVDVGDASESYNHTSSVWDLWGQWFYNMTNAVFTSNLLNTTIRSVSDSTYHNPTEAGIINGIVDGGELADVQHDDAQYDGVTFNFSEEVTGLDLRINFTGLDVTTFSRGIMRYKTSNLKGNFPLVQMWSYSDSEWEDYPELINSETFATMTQPVFDGADHIQDGVAQMRIYKDGGNTQNHYYIDWIAIVSGPGLPIGQEVDPVFNKWLEDSYLDSNLNGTRFNISADYFFTTNEICNATACFNLQDLNETGAGGSDSTYNATYANYNYSEGSLYYNHTAVSGGAGGGINTWELNLTSGVSAILKPLTTSLFDLGTTSLRWLTGYFENLNITGNTSMYGDLNMNNHTIFEANLSDSFGYTLQDAYDSEPESQRVITAKEGWGNAFVIDTEGSGYFTLFDDGNAVLEIKGGALPIPHIRVKDLIPYADNTEDLGYVTAVTRRWRDLFLAGKISDNTNSITMGNPIEFSPSVTILDDLRIGASTGESITLDGDDLFVLDEVEVGGDLTASRNVTISGNKIYANASWNGDITMEGGNISMVNTTTCYGDTCQAKIYYNGSSLIIKVT